MNNNTEPFKLIECEVNKILFEDERNYILTLLAEDKEYGISLNGLEGSLITFADSGCSENAHILTMHQIHIRFKYDCGFVLERIIIEAKHGDVFYCRAKWASDKGDLYNIVGIGDALVLHSLTKGELYITKYVLDQLDEFDSDGFMEISEV